MTYQPEKMYWLPLWRHGSVILRDDWDKFMSGQDGSLKVQYSRSLSSFCLTLPSVCLSLRLSVCLSVFVSVCLSVSVPVCLSTVCPPSVCHCVCLSVCSRVCFLSVCLSASDCLSVCLPVSVCICLYLSVCLSVCLLARLSVSVSVFSVSVCLSVCRSVGRSCVRQFDSRKSVSDSLTSKSFIFPTTTHIPETKPK